MQENNHKEIEDLLDKEIKIEDKPKREPNVCLSCEG
jgi:hypothetical protein